MNTITQTSKQIGLLTIALTIALVANFAYGQWADPTAAPTGNNATAPINVGIDYQVKAGNLGAIDLLAEKVRSDQYCNFAGDVCFSATTTAAMVNGGGSGGSSDSIGVGQQWYDVSASRRAGQSYRNTTGRPIMVAGESRWQSYGGFFISNDGVTWMNILDSSENDLSNPFSLIVPNGTYYRLNGAISKWYELRDAPPVPTEQSFNEGQVNNAVRALTGLSLERVASRPAERNAVCQMLFAGSRPINHGNMSFNSPGNNAIAWINNGVWQRVGAGSYNSQINWIQCSTN